MSKGPCLFIVIYDSASLVDAAKAYEDQLANGAKMMVSGCNECTAEIGNFL
jgi:deoxyhypusine synthase